MAPPPMTPREFQAETGVSRETLDRVAAHLDLLRKWQARINLVGPATLADPWRRHAFDSAQLWPLVPARAGTLLDMGSGAGFPGLTLAILADGSDRPLTVHLVEADRRKAAFLQEAVRAAGPWRAARVAVEKTRLESMTPFPADVITARALAPLPDLLRQARRFSSTSGISIFPKGQNVEKELTLISETRTFGMNRIGSRSDPSGTILVVEGLERVARSDGG